MTCSACPTAGKGYLWEALRNRAEERVDWTETHAMLRDLRNEAEFKRPYEPARTGAGPPRMPVAA